MWKWKRQRLAMLWFPEGAAGRIPEQGRRPPEGEEAEGRPSLILCDYFIHTPDPKLVCLQIPTGQSYCPI